MITSSQVEIPLTPNCSSTATIITAKRPSLPQQAGRALTKLDARAAHWAINLRRERAITLAGKGNRRRHIITVKPLVRPEPDFQKLAQALIEIAKQRLDDQKDEVA